MSSLKKLNKPKLGKLSTPVTANFPSEVHSATFPSEITSATTATPLSAVTFPFIKPDPDFIKTPISPPMAYTDFLSKAMSLKSPRMVSSGQITPDSATSAPDTSGSEPSDSPCKQEPPSPATSDADDKFISIKSPRNMSETTPPATAPLAPPSPFTSSMPMSAPPTGPATFPSLRVPHSPSVSNLDSPLRSPWSARSVQPAFDWDVALKTRFPEVKKKPSRTSVRHIREVVTRTVTYTPRMDPAPKGKRRKME